jgi:ATP/maltotriose-dependent transcriptional regulator MalT
MAGTHVRARPGTTAPSDHAASTIPFVGRADELALLCRVVEQARAGRRQVVLVQGPPGIGKSALLRRVIEIGGLPAVQASGSEDEASVPFALLDQLLRGSAGESTGVGSWLGTADPVAAGMRLLAHLSALQADRAIALVIDDLHWADTLSLQAVAFTLRRMRNDRVVTLLGYRPGTERTLPVGLERLLACEQGTIISLTGLTRSALGELAEALGARNLPRMALDRLAEITAGNPLHATALVDELDPQTLRGPEGAVLPAPKSYARTVLARLAGCPAETERLVVAASVLGTTCRLADAARLARIDHPLPAADDATQHRLLTSRSTLLGTELVFVHPLIRAAVYHDLGIARVATLHEAAAGIVEDEATRLRHRATASAGDDTELADDLSRFADRQLATGAPTSPVRAATAFQAAARVAGSRAARERYLLSALECILATGDAGSAAVLAEAVKDFEPTPRWQYLQGTLALLAGRVLEAEEMLTTGWEAIDADTDRSVAAGIAGQLATINLRRGNAAETALWAERSLWRGGARLPLGLSPQLTLPVGLATAGRYREALAVIPEVDDSPAHLGPRQLEWLVARGIVRLWRDDPQGARKDLVTTMECARRLGAFTPGLFALIYLSEAEFRLGAWDDAVVHGQLGVSMAEDADQVGTLALANGNAALPLSCRGQWDAAQQHVDACLQAVAQVPDETNVAWTHTARAFLASARGDHAMVVDSVRIIEATLHGGGDEPSIKPWRILGAESLAALGDPVAADLLLRHFERRAEAGPLPLARATASRARAVVEAAAGHKEDAERHFHLAVARGDGLAAPFERGQATLAFGGFLRRQGQRRRAAALLRTAHQIFVSLGAVPYIERAERELAGCGLTPSPRSGAAQQQLTPQEQTVAHLVAKGMRNRDVAAELVVSVKTIEYHLGNIFRKLEVASRTELAALLTRPRIP